MSRETAANCSTERERGKGGGKDFLNYFSIVSLFDIEGEKF